MEEVTIKVDLDKLAASMYWNRTPWSRIEGHKWHQLSEQSREGWRRTALLWLENRIADSRKTT